MRLTRAAEILYRLPWDGSWASEGLRRRINRQLGPDYISAVSTNHWIDRYCRMGLVEVTFSGNERVVRRVEP